MDNQLKPAPIFLIGVPRSGTTLLRMMIDSHPQIMCGPEAPWLAGRGVGNQINFQNLTKFLVHHKWGPVNGFTGIKEELIYEIVASSINEVMSTSAHSQGKFYWADKTPENIISVPFLYKLFPDAKFIHIFRDGRDVALSTKAGQWKTINLQSKYVKNNYINALTRWSSWIEKFQGDVRSLNITYLPVKYEDLVRSPREEMQRIFSFLEIEWNDKVLTPHKAAHDVVDQKGEGIQSFYNRQSVDTQSLYRWKTQLNWLQRYLTKSVAEEFLLELGYEPTL
jgi:protein-tyrosine sulfotransferase